MNKEEGLIELRRIIKDNVRHKDYKHVCDLADKYYKMVSGDGVTDLLRRIVSRETEEEFAQRKILTESVIPPTLSSTKLMFQRVARKKPKVRKIDWDTDNTEQKKAELEEVIKVYNGDASLERFLEYAFVDYNYLDPNAFLITEFDEFDSTKEKAKPYPFIATSEQAIMFEYKNNILQYLVVRLPIKYLKGDKETDGLKYTMYLGEDTIQLTEAEAGDITIHDKKYVYSEFKPKAKKVPARRFGYKKDPSTHGRTFISVFHEVLAYLNKMLKIDSELDISISMTAFPQRFRYVSPCPDCNKGKRLDGTTCGTCGGTGKEPVHSSTMDIQVFDLPRSPEEMYDLEKLSVTKMPPIELLEFMDKYINNLRASVYLLMFNKELVSRHELMNTATEVELTEDNVNDTLKPFATNYSVMWESTVEDIATFVDMGDKLILQHQYPDDFKLKSQSAMMRDLKEAKDAGAATSTISAIEDDINELIYADRPEELKIIRIKNDFNPFRGYPEENVRLIISQNLTTEYNAVLWSNLEAIFNELERENKDWIYDKADDVIKSMVDEKVEKYRSELTKPQEPTYEF